MSKFEINDDEFRKMNGRVAIITGGSSGIGLATAKLFVSNGAQVIIGDLNPPREPVDNSTFVQLDVTSWSSLVSLFEKARETYGRVDVVFANAGVASSDMYVLDAVKIEAGKLLEPTHRTVNINLIACMNTVILGINYMSKQKEGVGSIIVTASASSYQQFIVSDYATAKHGVLGFMRSLVDQLSPTLPIRINAIAPSWTETGIVNKDAVSAVGIATQPASVVARSVALLAVDETRHGQTIFSARGEYRELEGSILESTQQAIGESISEGEAVKRMFKLRPEKEGA